MLVARGGLFGPAGLTPSGPSSRCSDVPQHALRASVELAFGGSHPRYKHKKTRRRDGFIYAGSKGRIRTADPGIMSAVL